MDGEQWLTEATISMSFPFPSRLTIPEEILEWLPQPRDSNVSSLWLVGSQPWLLSWENNKKGSRTDSSTLIYQKSQE